MAITTLDGIIAGAKQRILLNKSASRTSVALIPFSIFDLAGSPGAGVLAGTSTTTGVVPTDATAGTPIINAFGGGNTGYISRLEFNSSVACRIQLYDLLWKGGAYPFNAAVTGQTPASYSNRVPGGTDFTGLELWYEQVTASTGIQSVNVTYNNQAGTAGRTTGVTSQGTAGIVGRMLQLSLQSGDSGIQGVTGVAGTIATVGTFNILVMRPLGEARIRVANDGVVQDALATGMPIVFADSALVMIVTADSTATGLPECNIDVVNG
jgi:hypothetical protein